MSAQLGDPSGPPDIVSPFEKFQATKRSVDESHFPRARKSRRLTVGDTMEISSMTLMDLTRIQDVSMELTVPVSSLLKRQEDAHKALEIAGGPFSLKNEELTQKVSSLSEKLAEKERSTSKLIGQLRSERHIIELKSLEKDQLIERLEKKITQLESGQEEMMNELQLALERQEEENKTLHAQLKDSMDACNAMGKEKMQLIRQVSSLEASLSKAHMNMKELEGKVGELETGIVLSKTMQEKVLRLPSLEAELLEVQKDNLALREKIANTFLLKEQNTHLQAEVERLKERMAEMAEIHAQVSSLDGELSSWKKVSLQMGLPDPSPEDLANYVANLQCKDLQNTEQISSIKADLAMEQRRSSEASGKAKSLEERLCSVEKMIIDKDAILKKYSRKLMLLSKEVQSYKQILDSCEKDTTINLTDERVAQLEELLQEYRQFNDSLSMQRSSNEELEKIQKLQEKLQQLETEKEHLSQDRKRLEELLEHRVRGDYNPAQTKVFRYSMNPLAQAQEEREKQLESLEVDNARLKERIRLMEEGEALELTQRAAASVDVNTTKELERLKVQLKNSEMKTTRMMEAFKQTSIEFRQTIHALMGYQVEKMSGRHYKVLSVYADSPNDYLHFQVGSHAKGTLELLETEFSKAMSEDIEHFLVAQHSIPAFLSNITLKLYGQQTLPSSQ
ncbi:unnamed protein product [Darwinula stevensoni]|uniref:Mitotic spindle assembly checkpoint protein MAD1 n=1 Tax=Darwinula stevensoni TaxID=69355 RepID=A0A7R8WZZ8_9CRUS|nr:unnamed protein product [Darwinula stevensoni]CAG0880566.1 unnamed protein product [Darwinula stevensoni]